MAGSGVAGSFERDWGSTHVVGGGWGTGNVWEIRGDEGGAYVVSRCELWVFVGTVRGRGKKRRSYDTVGVGGKKNAGSGRVITEFI